MIWNEIYITLFLILTGTNLFSISEDAPTKTDVLDWQQDVKAMPDLPALSSERRAVPVEILRPQSALRHKHHKQRHYGVGKVHAGLPPRDMHRRQEMYEMHQAYNAPMSDDDHCRLDNLTTKIWKNVASYEIQSSWIHPFCLRTSELIPEMETVWARCQNMGIDWSCVYTQLAGGETGMSLVRVGTLFNNVDDEELKSRLLFGLDKCREAWKVYKMEEKNHIIYNEVQNELMNRVWTDDKEEPFHENNYEDGEDSGGGNYMGRNSGRNSGRNQYSIIRHERFDNQEDKIIKEKIINESMKADDESDDKGDNSNGGGGGGGCTGEGCRQLSMEQPVTVRRPVFEHSHHRHLPSVMESRARDILVDKDLDKEERVELELEMRVGACIKEEVVKACEPKVIQELAKLM